MEFGANARLAALTTACVLAAYGVLAACGGDSANPPPGGSIDSGNPPPGDDSGVSPADDSGNPPPPSGDSAAPPSKPKAIGSPCSLGTDCATGTCDTSIVGGMCTEDCTSDTNCTEKGGNAACVNGLCYAFCKVAEDGGAPVADGGKVEGPCKNKVFQCEAEPGETAPVCIPPDGGVVGDDAGPSMDATTTADASDASGE